MSPREIDEYLESLGPDEREATLRRWLAVVPMSIVGDMALPPLKGASFDVRMIRGSNSVFMVASRIGFVIPVDTFDEDDARLLLERAARANGCV